MGFFNSKSQMVKSALLLFTVGIYEDISQVPDVLNLREVVAEELKKMQ